jgi:hypothetical protein
MRKRYVAPRVVGTKLLLIVVFNVIACVLLMLILELCGDREMVA